jgi:hypothetical protein
MKDPFVLTKKEREVLIEIWKLPFLEGCKKIGVRGREIVTPYGTLRIIEGSQAER